MKVQDRCCVGRKVCSVAFEDERRWSHDCMFIVCIARVLVVAFVVAGVSLMRCVASCALLLVLRCFCSPVGVSLRRGHFFFSLQEPSHEDGNQPGRLAQTPLPLPGGDQKCLTLKVGQDLTCWQHEQLSLQMALADAVHHSAQPRARTGAPAATDAETQTVVEFFAPVSGATYAAPAPVVHAAPASVTEFLVPVLSDFLEPPVPIVTVVQAPQLQITEKVVEIPEIWPGHTNFREFESCLPFAVFFFLADTVEMVELELPLPADPAPPLRETTPVVDAPPVEVELVSPAPVVEPVAPAPAVSYAAPAPVAEHVPPTPAVAHAAPAPEVQFVPPTPAVAHAAPAPVVQFVDPTPAASAAPGPLIEESAPAPCVSHAALALMVEHLPRRYLLHACVCR